MAKKATKADKDRLKAEGDKLATKLAGEGKTILTCDVDDTIDRLVFEMAWPDGSPGTYMVRVPAFMAPHPLTGFEEPGDDFIKRGGLEAHIREGLIRKAIGMTKGRV